MVGSSAETPSPRPSIAPGSSSVESIDVSAPLLPPNELDMNPLPPAVLLLPAGPFSLFGVGTPEPELAEMDEPTRRSVKLRMDVSRPRRLRFIRTATGSGS